MPRSARMDIPGALHHIMVRGINRADIFKDQQDKTQFLERLGEFEVGESKYAPPGGTGKTRKDRPWAQYGHNRKRGGIDTWVGPVLSH